MDENKNEIDYLKSTFVDHQENLLLKEFKKIINVVTCGNKRGGSNK